MTINHPAAVILETERLRLTPHRLTDFDDSLAMWSDPAVTRFIGGRPLTGEDVWGRLLRHAGLWSLLGFGYWVVRARESGRFVGEVGFADFRRDIKPDLGERPELGWVLATWAHGQGFATEAVRAALAWSDQAWGERETVCIISDGNTSSRRVAEKVGFVPRGPANYKGAEMTLLARRGAAVSALLVQ